MTNTNGTDAYVWRSDRGGHLKLRHEAESFFTICEGVVRELSSSLLLLLGAVGSLFYKNEQCSDALLI